jgi:cytochrome c oxidase subunit II
MHRSERIWLIAGIITLIVFLGILGVAAVHDDIVPPSHLKTIDPAKIAQTPPFDNPGLRQLDAHTYEAYIVAHIFSFNPSTITVPVGATVHFYATSPDVVHGFFITNTAINMMVVPGWVSEDSHTFETPGTYLLLCNEYCGSGHHFMYGEVVVK